MARRARSVGRLLAPCAFGGVVALAAACSSDGEGAKGGTGPGDPTTMGGGATQLQDGSFTCNPAAGPSTSPLRRLSVLQYQNTLRDLFGSTLEVTSVAAEELTRIPIDDAPFKIMDARLSDQHVRAYYRIADKLAAASIADDATLTAVAGACALDATPTPSCVDAFLDGFGTRALRHPLSAEERATYTALNDGTRDTRELFRALLFVLLQAGPLVYHLELDGSAVAGDDNYYQLAAYDLASRLSYHFWQSMPDAELFAAAADGSLLSEQIYSAQVNRLFSDQRTRTAIDLFYTEWWHVGWLNAFPDTPAMRTLAQGTTLFDAGADHLQAMTQEIRDLTEYFTFTTPGTYKDLLLTDLSFTRSPHLAALYGVQPWDGSSAYPQLPAGERSGILTRGAFLVNDTHTTHPIHRGVIVRRRILCDDIPQPDPASLPEGSLIAPPITPDMTTRQRFENKTAAATCMACHSQFNPIGYVLERYDALGRYRTEERILDETSGQVLATLPLDASATPRLDPNDERSIDNGPALSDMVAAATVKTEPCFARQYFRFTYARQEGEADGCALEGVRSALSGAGNLGSALRAIALEPGFRARRAM